MMHIIPSYRSCSAWMAWGCLRVLTPTVCCLQLLSSLYANKVTAYINGHDHSMTVGNPQQENVTQAYASSWLNQQDDMP